MSDKDNEIWVDIRGYKGLYQVSNLGRVKSVERIVQRTSGRWGSPSPYKKKEMILKLIYVHGYYYVSLCKDGKSIRHAVHRLVAQAFLPNENNLPQVNHKDENKNNNKADNLEWCDVNYNINYGTARKRHSQTIVKNGSCRRGKNGHAKKVICDGVVFDCITDCAEHYSVSAATLSGYLVGCDPMPPRWKAMGLSYYKEVT